MLELSIDRNILGLTGNTMIFDFKWADNPIDLENPISFINGDAAPNRRFNYRFIWNK